MRCLGFNSAAEIYVYATCVFLGISMLMPLNAITSAPAYMIFYYKYVTGDEFATPNIPVFWANILTFYNVVSVPTQIIVGPTVLLPWARKLSLNTRFICALSLMMVEVFVILVMPAGKTSQGGAITAFVIVTVAAGAGKSYLEATCYALVGDMKPKFMSAVMFGCGFSGVIASILQCVIKASMSDDYHSVQRQAYIYFSLALAFMAVSLTMALCLRFNSYAQEHVAEYRAWKRVQDAKARCARGEPADDEIAGQGIQQITATGAAAMGQREPTHHESLIDGQIVLDDGVTGEQSSSTQAAASKEAKLTASDEADDDAVRAVAMPDGENSSDSEDAAAQENMTTSEQMQNTRAWPIVKAIWPMQLSCFCIFFVSLFIFPSLVLPIDRTSKWFSTIAILLYNCGDATGRFSSSLKFLWPSRKVLLIVSFCRFAFIPLIFLCIYGYIPSLIAPYVFMVCIGLTNGFFGATSMVFGPATKTLKTAGQRVMAGQLMGIALLAGASVACLLAMLTILVMDK